MLIRGSTPKAQIASYQKLMDGIGKSFVRGVAFSLNGVAKDAQARIKEMLPKVLDQPTAFTVKGIGARYIPLSSTSLEGVSATVFVLPDQSAYEKYLFGPGRNVRAPGDVGPADKYIYVPLWPNLTRIGVKPVGGGGLPRNTLQRFAREAGVDLAGGRQKRVVVKKRRRVSGANGGIFFGAPTFGGTVHGLGFWSRPIRKRVNGKLINEGRPMMLVRAADHATYDPLLQAAWAKAAEEAMATLPQRLKSEYIQKLDHLGLPRPKEGPLSRLDDFLRAK